ncbi:MAG: AmmeMemoRadiSam system radical SAM enzyme [Rubrivivax sp.]
MPERTQAKTAADDGDAPFPARWWHALPDGRIQCDLCPRDCRLHEGQHGLCFVRRRAGDALVLGTYGRSSGFAIDPIEKKPLAHFLPGSTVLSFGTAGCNLACKFCQNWDISKSRAMDRLQDRASPERIAEAAAQAGCASVAFTYNDPVIFAEYAMDTADACRARGVKTVAVTAGYMHAEPRRAFYARMDAANVDLKAFSDAFYFRQTGAHLAPVLETLEHIVHETDCWLEITTLLIPGHNDGNAELEAMARWIVRHLGPEVPLHFTAFHPDYKMTDVAATPLATVRRARAVALANGLVHVYTGNVRDTQGGTTCCRHCEQPLIERDGHRLLRYELDDAGRCRHCGTPLAGRFGGPPPVLGRRHLPMRVRMA